MAAGILEQRGELLGFRHDLIREALYEGSLAARVVGAERTAVKSHHHQGIKEVGEGLQVTGWAVEDDAVEALEDPSCPFVLGVLWHPEEDENSQLIKALVSEVS